jgi:hypothetical protein
MCGPLISLDSMVLLASVVDPDPGSGGAFLTPDPGIRDGLKSDPG